MQFKISGKELSKYRGLKDHEDDKIYDVEFDLYSPEKLIVDGTAFIIYSEDSEEVCASNTLYTLISMFNRDNDCNLKINDFLFRDNRTDKNMGEIKMEDILKLKAGDAIVN